MTKITPIAKLYVHTVLASRRHSWDADYAGHKPPPPEVVASPQNLAVLLTHCGQLILRKK